LRHTTRIRGQRWRRIIVDTFHLVIRRGDSIMLRLMRTSMAAAATAAMLAAAPAARAADVPTPAPASAPAPAVQAGWHHGPQRAWFDHMLRRVHASDAQREKIRAVVRGAREQRRATWQQLHELQRRQWRLLGAPTIDRAALEALRAQRMGLLEQASKQRLNTEIAIAEVLDAPQRAQLFELLQRGHRRGMR
jgi:Spy/CpxP family protein refolding chaperone